MTPPEKHEHRIEARVFVPLLLAFANAPPAPPRFGIGAMTELGAD